MAPPSRSTSPPSRRSRFGAVCRWLCLLALATPFSHASARANEWAIVPTTAGELPPMLEAVVDEVERELRRQGRQVWAAQPAIDQFERRMSREPPTITEAEFERWLAHSQAGIRTLALGDHDVALGHLKEANAAAETWLPALARTPEHAQRVLDTCLYLVRALLEVDDDTRARERAAECVSLMPRGVPQPLMHPPKALELLRDVKARVVDRRSTLRVAGNRSGCDVRINGVVFGVTPFETNELPAGHYGVQVECEPQPARVHPVTLGNREYELFVDSEVDRLVRTVPLLRLEHSPEDRSMSPDAGVAAIAKALNARWVVLVSAPEPRTIALDLVAEDASRTACARVKVGERGARSDGLALAVRELLAGHCADPTTAAGHSSELFKPGI